jgi:hypothetical protein
MRILPAICFFGVVLLVGCGGGPTAPIAAPPLIVDATPGPTLIPTPVRGPCGSPCPQ